MKTKAQIKNDLKEIKYYYSKKEMFDKSATKIVKSSVVELAYQYNQYIIHAPAQLFDLYISLYTENNSQLYIASEMNVTPEYICRLNARLVSFFVKCFNAAE